MVYAWKPGARKYGSAQTAGEICASLEADGNLNAQALVDVSRPEDAPLHGAFEWDDARAGEEWRRHQARNIINAIVIREEEKEPVRAFFNLTTEGNRYMSVTAIVRQEDKYRQLLEDAREELKTFRRKYESLAELQTLFSCMDALAI